MVARRVLGAADCDDPTMCRRDGPSDILTASEIKMILPESLLPAAFGRVLGRRSVAHARRAKAMSRMGDLPCPGVWLAREPVQPPIIFAAKGQTSVLGRSGNSAETARSRRAPHHVRESLTQGALARAVRIGTTCYNRTLAARSSVQPPG